MRTKQKVCIICDKKFNKKDMCNEKDHKLFNKVCIECCLND
jgi:hypothetical protein